MNDGSFLANMEILKERLALLKQKSVIHSVDLFFQVVFQHTTFFGVEAPSIRFRLVRTSLKSESILSNFDSNFLSILSNFLFIIPLKM
jgi:hypothetical protein